jgi:hypothetical protein
MTYQKMSDEFLDKELAEVKKGLSAFRQSRVKQERMVTEAIKQKYHSPSKKACTVYMKFKAAGFSDFAADSMCRQAHKYNINPNLDLQRIINAVKAKTAQLNNQRSSEPDNSGVLDRSYPESSYGSDVPSCIASLTSIGVDPQRASVECETQHAGKGYRGGNKWYSTPSIKGPSNFTVRKATGSLAIRTHSASIQDEVPYWAQISCSDEVAATPRIRGIHNSIRSASDISAAKKYHDAITEDISTTMRSRAENRVNEISQQRTKSAKYDGKSSWAIACNL